MASANTDDQSPLTISEAAQILGVSISTLRRWEREGLIIPFRTPAGHRRYHPADLRAIKAERSA